MKHLICEVCESDNIIKQDGLFICQSCGAKYSIEEIKKMVSEGSANVSRGTIKIDTSEELANLYQIARRAKDDNNGENAAKYYDMILIKDPTSWEASFFVVYFKAMECKIAHIQIAAISVSNCIDTVLRLINDYVENKEKQSEAVGEVTTRCIILSNLLYNAAKNHYEDIDISIRQNYTQEMVNNCFSATNIMYTLGDNIDSIFESIEGLNNFAVLAWKSGIILHSGIMRYLTQKDSNKAHIMTYATKIQKYESTYQLPEIDENTTNGGCYIATAVYGSYDCPHVWILRRYRDSVLSKNMVRKNFYKHLLSLKS